MVALGGGQFLMSEVPLYGFRKEMKALNPAGVHYLAHTKAPPSGTLQQGYASGPMVVLGSEGCVPGSVSFEKRFFRVQGYLAHKENPPP